MQRRRLWLLVPLLALLACPKKKADDDAPADNRPPAKHPCADLQSIECHAAHLGDPDPSERRKALEGLQANLEKVDLTDASAVRSFADRALPDMVSALTVESPRPTTEDRRGLIAILAKCADVRAKPAFLGTFTTYTPGVDDDIVLDALRGISAHASDPAYHDDTTATALTDLFGKARWTAAQPKSIEVGERAGDLIASVGAKSAVKKLLEVIKLPNDGQDYGTARETSMAQIVAARTLGKLGDTSVIPDLVDTMYDHAARIVASTDYTTGAYMTRASPLTTATSRAMAAAIVNLGGISALLPYARNDLSDAKVKAASIHFYRYRDVNGNLAPGAYADLPIDGVGYASDPKLGGTLETMLGAATTDADRRALARMLLAATNEKAALEAVKKAADATSTPEAKAFVLGQLTRAGQPDLAGDLLEIAKDKKNDAVVRQMASTSAMWLAGKDKIADVGATFDKKTSKDPAFPALEATSEYCDPDTVPIEKAPRCLLAPGSTYDYVMYNDVSPSFADELTLVTDLVNSCDKGSACYLAALTGALSDLEARGAKPLDAAAAKTAAKAQKAAMMLGAYASEDDAVKLAKTLSTLGLETSRSAALAVLDRALPAGSTKVADVLEGIITDDRTKTSTVLPRDESQLGAIAAKLRARVPSK